MNSTQPSSQGLLPMLASVVLFAANVFLIRWVNLLSSSADGWMVAFFRGIVGLVITVAIFGGGRGLNFRNIFTRPILLARGFFGAVGILLFYLTVIELGAGRAVIINLTYPIFGALIAGVFLKEVPSRSALVWMVLGFLGLVIFLGPKSINSGPSFYDGLAVIGALMAGIVIVLIRQLHQSEHTSTIYGAQGVWGIFAAAPMSVGTINAVPIVVIALLCLGGVIAAAGQLLMTNAYRYLPVAKGASIQMLLPILTAIGGALLFGEQFERMEIFGGCLTLFATYRVILLKN